MRLRKWSPILGGGLLLLVAIFVLFHQHQSVYPTPETQSAFFRQYSPEAIAKPYFSQYSWWMRGGESSGAGERSATHSKDFDYHFVFQTENWMPLMTALAEDMREQLGNRGAELTSFSGDPRRGFRYEYIFGNAVGSATISPLETPDRQQRRPKCMRGSEQTARVQVTIHEEWFKEKPGLMRVSVRSDIR